MADLLQLDAAAALVGKSEVTLRRLIKAGRIPVQKEKTLTGFIYLVNPDDVKAYYHSRGESIEVKEGGEAILPTAVRRLAVAGESGSATEYWQKRAEAYEDRYHSELNKHATTREELGVWRGRAEHAQAMLMKMLPAPTEVNISESSKEPVKSASEKESSPLLTFLSVVVSLCFLVLVGGVIYFFVLHR